MKKHWLLHCFGAQKQRKNQWFLITFAPPGGGGWDGMGDWVRVRQFVDSNWIFPRDTARGLTALTADGGTWAAGNYV